MHTANEAGMTVNTPHTRAIKRLFEASCRLRDAEQEADRARKDFNEAVHVLELIESGGDQ